MKLKEIKFIALVVFVFWAVGSRAIAETYYVAPPDHPETPGDDSRTPEQAQNPDTPWATIQKAADNAINPGDTVMIKTGTYFAPDDANATPVLELKASGSADKPIVFKSFIQSDSTWDQVILDGRGHGFNKWVVHGSQTDYVIFEGLTVTRGYYYGFHLSACKNVIIRHCTAYDNTEDGNASAGFQIIGRSDNLLIEYCESYGNGCGIIVGTVHQEAGTQPDNVAVRCCLVHENIKAGGDSDGLAASSVTNSLFSHIVSYGNSDDGYDFGREDLKNNVIECNIAFGNNLQMLEGAGNGFKIGQMSYPQYGTIFPHHNILRNNISFCNTCWGFEDGNSDHNIYYNNIAYKNKSWGWLIAGKQGGSHYVNEATLHNNIMYANDWGSPGGASDDIAVGQNPPQEDQILDSDYNLIGDDEDFNKMRAANWDLHSLNEDPLFSNPPEQPLEGMDTYVEEIAKLKAHVVLNLYTDAARKIVNSNFGYVPGFELNSNSPCIDAGQDVGLPFVGNGPDIGAYEYNPQALVESKPVSVAPGDNGLCCYNNVLRVGKKMLVGIVVDVKEASAVRVVIYDSNGRAIRVLLAGNKPVGQYRLAWDGRDGAGEVVGSGIYFVHMKAGRAQGTEKIVVVN